MPDDVVGAGVEPDEAAGADAVEAAGVEPDEAAGVDEEPDELDSPLSEELELDGGLLLDEL